MIEITQLPNRNILASARAFYNAALILKNEEFSDRSIPLIVNSALALELYLKSFNSKKIFKNGERTLSGITIYKTVVDEANKRGHNAHNLLNLYNSIDNQTKQVIENEYNSTRESFEIAISEYNNIFVEWRYVFEGKAKGLDITKIFNLLKTLEETALTLEKQS